MKIRNGFVSNSSTSSFTIIIERSAHDKIFKELPEWVKVIVKGIKEGSPSYGAPIELLKFLGKEVIVIKDLGDASGHLVPDLENDPGMGGKIDLEKVKELAQADGIGAGDEWYSFVYDGWLRYTSAMQGVDDSVGIKITIG